MSNANTTAKNVRDRFEKLADERSRITERWRMAAMYCLPEHQRTVTGVAGGDVDPESEHVLTVNSIAALAAQRLAAGLYGNTVSPSEPWFSLRPVKSADNTPEYQLWLAEATRVIFGELGKSNFALELQNALLDYVVFGMAVLYVDYGDGLLHFRAFSPVDCFIEEDAEGRPNGLYRGLQYTPQQLVEKFGDAVPDVVHRRIEDNDTDTLTVVHAVFPRGVAGIFAGGVPLSKDRKPWASLYVLAEDDADIPEPIVLDQGGYDSFPFQIARFQKPDNGKYGRSPAMIAMPDITMLQRIEQDVANTAEMAAQPPLFLPDDEAIDVVDLTPAAVNPYDATRGQPWTYPVSGIAFQEGLAYIERKEGRVKQAFFVDLFAALEDRKNMSATEVVQRVNEKIQSIAPMIARLQTELYAPMIERVFSLLVQNGEIELPQEAERPTFHPVFVSRMQAKLAQIDNDALMRATQQAAALVGAIRQLPELADVIDVEKAVRLIFLNNNVDPDLVRSGAESRKIREQREQAEQQARALEATKTLMKPVDAMKRPEPGSPAEAVLPGMTGQGQP